MEVDGVIVLVEEVIDRLELGQVDLLADGGVMIS